MKVCWNVTNLCNEDCIYCFRELNEPALSIEENLKILYKLKNAGVDTITFAGGEPLVYHDLITLLRESKKLGIKNNLITNGSLLNENNIGKYLQYIDKITFSLDSPSDYVNEVSGRGVEHYKHIRKILQYINFFHSNTVIEINSVVTKENLNEVDFMFQKVADELIFYGIKKWKVSRFLPLRGHAKLREDLLEVSDDAFEEIKNKYSNGSSLFDISVRDYDSYDKDFQVSPGGGLKISDHKEEKILISDINKVENDVLVKKLGGRGV